MTALQNGSWLTFADRRKGGLANWDAHHRIPPVAGNPTLSAIVRRLQRSNRIEDADHLELHTAVREVAS